MPANTLAIFPNVPQTTGIAIVPADTTTEKTLVTAAVNGTRIDAISGVSSDTADRVVQLIMNDGANSFPLGEVTIPAGAGTNGTTKAKQVLNPVDLPWLDESGAIFLKAGCKLNMKSEVTVTAAKQLTFVSFHGDY